MEKNKNTYTTLCGVSTVLTVISFLVIPVFIFGAIAPFISEGKVNVSPVSGFAMLIGCSACFIAGLIMAIVAAAKNKGKAWAVILIVVDGFMILAGICILGLMIFAGVLARGYVARTYDTHYDIQMTADTENDIEVLLDNHRFDTGLLEDYPNSSLVNLDMNIYIDTHATHTYIENVDIFLREIRQLIIYHGGQAEVRVYTFDPDNEGELTEYGSFTVQARSSDGAISVSDLLSDGSGAAETVTGDVPVGVETGNMLIVVRDPRGPK